MTWTLRLEDLDRDDLAIAGGKGAGLGELTRAGLPVPPGFVVSAAAYREHLRSARLADRICEHLRDLAADDLAAVEAAGDRIRGWIETAEIPEAIAEEIAAAYAALGGRMPGREGDPAVAVRSSATAEDLPEASFAGQQETYLDVRGEADLLAAVRRCWASLFGTRALAYRVRMGFDPLDVALAVVVQAMVPAEVAGVMFTANPLTGAEEFVVTASYGLGETVVGGLVTPDTFVLNARGKVLSRTLGGKERRFVPDGGKGRFEPVSKEDGVRYCLGDAHLAALAKLGTRASRHFGAPQDIEWALSAGRIHLLQSRPITTLARGAGVPASPSRWDRAVARHVLEDLTEHCPEMPRPLDFCVVEAATDGVSAMLADLGIRFAPAASFTSELPDGRMVFRPRRPRISPALVWRLPRRLARALREDPGEAWSSIGEALARDVEDARGATLEGLEPTALVEAMQRVTSIGRRYLPPRFQRVILTGLVHEKLVRFWVRRAVGRTDAAARTRELYVALPYSTARMNREVMDLAAVASAHGRSGPELDTALRHFLERWGDRPVSGVVALPSVATWREEPSAVLGLVEALAADPCRVDAGALDARQCREFEAAREAVARRLGRFGRRCFEASLRRARAYLVAREDGFAAFEKGIAHLRRAALELGTRLCASGVLASVDDIFFVRFEELGLLARGELPGIHGRVVRRRRAHAEVSAACARGESWLTASGSISAERSPPRASGDGNGLEGLPASPGRAAGPVCVVRGPADFGKLRRGDVLVAPVTAPAWTPLFALAAAVVTETGGSLSHAAIVAREYGIPAVLAVKGATSLLADGLRVVVDGGAGRVEREAPRDGRASA